MPNDTEETTNCKVVEKIPHTYNLSGKKLAEMCRFKGVVIGLEAESFTIQNGNDKGKTAYKITVRTMERADQA